MRGHQGTTAPDRQAPPAAVRPAGPLRQAAARALRALAARLVPPRGVSPAAPYQAFIDAGSIHPTALLANAAWTLCPGAEVTIGENSLCSARLAFYRPAVFRMGARSSLGARSEVHISRAITIGDDVLVSWGCTLIDSDLHSLCFADRADDVLMIGNRDGRSLAQRDWNPIACGAVVIEDKAWIGLRSIVLMVVTVGEGSVVGAGSVVCHDVPPWTVVAGNPARPVRHLSRRDCDDLQACKQASATNIRRCDERLLTTEE